MPPPPRLAGAAPRGSAPVLAVVVVEAVVAPATLGAAGAVAAGETDPATVVALDAAVGADVPTALGLAALVVATAGAVVGLAAVGVLAVLDPPQAARSTGRTKSIAIPMRDACMRGAINRVLTPPTLPTTCSVTPACRSSLIAPNRTGLRGPHQS